MTTTATLTPELTTTCPPWCAHTSTCDPASVEEGGGGGLWHQGAVTVVSTAEHAGVSARLELFDDPADEFPHRYSVEINRRIDVPIEHARELGEYLIKMSDQYGPPRS